jgi:Xaa-Pro aminopeptidase
MKMSSVRRAGTRCLAVLALLALAPAVHATPLGDDLAARRARVEAKLPPSTLLILWSAPTRNYSGDVDYEYRQESNLYYLSGITQEETILAVVTGAQPHEVLFVKPRDPSREHWFGRVLSTGEAAAQSGVRDVETLDRFQAFVDGLLTRREASRLALLLPAPAADAPAAAPSPEAEFARKTHERFRDVDAVDVSPILTELRLVKTPYEQSLLIRCLEISSAAQMAGMRVAKPGAFEYQVKAAIEGDYKSHGAISWAYPSIVGSGPNATILHYPESARQMQNGDLLLVDAAANYEYMAGDITRTYPVNGRFTQPQKDIYAIVLQAQDAAMNVARAGSSIAQVHAKAVEIIRAGLLKLGLITDASGDQYKMWFTHGTSHFIGIDVHDVGGRDDKFVPGVAFTIEPGIYIRQSALDALPKTPENAELVHRIQPTVNKYLDIGIRVEDSFLLEPDGPRRLSSLPRTIDEIESFLRKNR